MFILDCVIGLHTSFVFIQIQASFFMVYKVSVYVLERVPTMREKNAKTTNVSINGVFAENSQVSIS